MREMCMKSPLSKCECVLLLTLCVYTLASSVTGIPLSLGCVVSITANVCVENIPVLFTLYARPAKTGSFIQDYPSTERKDNICSPFVRWGMRTVSSGNGQSNHRWSITWQWMWQHEPSQGIWCVISVTEKARESEMEWENKYQYTL